MGILRPFTSRGRVSQQSGFLEIVRIDIEVAIISFVKEGLSELYSPTACKHRALCAHALFTVPLKDRDIKS